MKATTLINRYDIKAYKLFSLLHEFDKLLSLELPTRKRGRPPKLNPRIYLQILLSKEYLGHSLGIAEQVDSMSIARRRVPKSTLSYWEQKAEIRKAISSVLSLLSEKLERLLGYEISILDSTKFTSWLKELVEIHAYCFTSSQSIGLQLFTC